MNESVATAAQSWINHIEKNTKLNKQARRAVMSFAIWLDNVIEQEERREENKHDTEN